MTLQEINEVESENTINDDKVFHNKKYILVNLQLNGCSMWLGWYRNRVNHKNIFHIQIIHNHYMVVSILKVSSDSFSVKKRRLSIKDFL